MFFLSKSADFKFSISCNNALASSMSRCSLDTFSSSVSFSLRTAFSSSFLFSNCFLNWFRLSRCSFEALFKPETSLISLSSSCFSVFIFNSTDFISSFLLSILRCELSIFSLSSFILSFTLSIFPKLVSICFSDSLMLSCFLAITPFRVSICFLISICSSSPLFFINSASSVSC